MTLKIGIENGAEGRTIAWMLEHPGCYAYGKNDQEALSGIGTAIREYNNWLTRHGQVAWTIPDDQEVYIEETWDVYSIDSDYELVSEGYEINAWFRHDWKPLRSIDVERATKLLAMSRADLLSTVRGLDQEVIDTTYPDERWSITGILMHVGGAEWWYLDRLGLAFDREEVPSEPFERLARIRELLIKTLPELEASTQVIGIDGQIWSPRKVLRRALWHERDHTAHIQKLLGS
jgi:hypothetical protein